MGPMSHHATRLVWTRTDAPFRYETYVRDHRLELETGSVLAVSAAPDYRGNPRLTNPEELLVGALSSCHMLTFLAICARKGLEVERYEDEAVGTLARPEGGPMQLTECVLRPKVRFAGEAPDATTLRSLHVQAHKGCFIASSVKTDVRVEL
jgi:organic hydroperoxide reductase OsmC/OhrA